jgi:hypothetical protein
MAIISLYRPPGLVLGTDPIGGRASDHSRTAINESVKRIETTNRMANGTLRKYVVATKREWSTSWDLLPHTSRYTVDGFMGALELIKFYEEHPYNFQVTVVNGQIAGPGDAIYRHPATEVANKQRLYRAKVYQAHFTDFSAELVKRGDKYDMYNVSLSMEEI